MSWERRNRRYILPSLRNCRRRGWTPYNGGELRFQGFNFSRQLDGAKQLGPLADNAAHLAGFVGTLIAIGPVRARAREESRRSRSDSSAMNITLPSFAICCRLSTSSRSRGLMPAHL